MPNTKEKAPVQSANRTSASASFHEKYTASTPFCKADKKEIADFYEHLDEAVLRPLTLAKCMMNDNFNELFSRAFNKDTPVWMFLYTLESSGARHYIATDYICTAMRNLDGIITELEKAREVLA